MMTINVPVFKITSNSKQIHSEMFNLQVTQEMQNKLSGTNCQLLISSPWGKKNKKKPNACEDVYLSDKPGKQFENMC